MEPNLSSKLVTPDLLTPIAKVNSTFPIPYKFSLLDSHSPGADCFAGKEETFTSRSANAT